MIVRVHQMVIPIVVVVLNDWMEKVKKKLFSSKTTLLEVMSGMSMLVTLHSITLKNHGTDVHEVGSTSIEYSQSRKIFISSFIQSYSSWSEYCCSCRVPAELSFECRCYLQPELQFLTRWIGVYSNLVDHVTPTPTLYDNRSAVYKCVITYGHWL